MRLLCHLHESTQEEKEIICLEPQKFLPHSMFDTEDINIDYVILLTEYRKKHSER